MQRIDVLENDWSINERCTGKGWRQDNKPCMHIWNLLITDIQSRIYTDMSGIPETYFGFTCPDCGCFTEIAENKLTPEVKNYAQNNTYTGKTGKSNTISW